MLGTTTCVYHVIFISCNFQQFFFSSGDQSKKRLAEEDLPSKYT